MEMDRKKLLETLKNCRNAERKEKSPCSICELKKVSCSAMITCDFLLDECIRHLEEIEKESG